MSRGLSMSFIVLVSAFVWVLGCSPEPTPVNHWDGGGDGGVDGGGDSGRPDADGLGDADGPSPDADRPTGPPDAAINPDAFFAEDPPPQYCGPDDRPAPDPPGGTPECPDDKNREGCPCDTAGDQAPCWPGLRVDRNRGICRDGTTTCVPVDEFGYGRWGTCDGFVLPVEGAIRGPEACNCFSAGWWMIDNLVPCFITSSDGQAAAVSTFVASEGAQPACPTSTSGWPPAPEPGYDFSTSSISIDCDGQFRLCLTLKAGDAEAPADDDCVIAQVCTETWYQRPEDGSGEVMTELPPLPSWASSDTACVNDFMDNGGYAEMSVIGLSVECEEVGTEEEPYVFNRVNYCPLLCNEPENADLPECESCGSGGSGRF